MPKRIEYNGALERFYELPITGKHGVWTRGLGGEVPDADAALLLAAGVGFTTDPVPALIRDGQLIDPAGNVLLGAAIPAADVARVRAGWRLGPLLKARAPCTMHLAGDSTGNETTEWFYKFGQKIAARFPEYRIEHLLWNTTTVGYDAATVISAPVLAQVLAFDDTFTTTSAATFGRQPDRTDGALGNSWSRDGVGADGDWSVSAGKLVRSADTTVSAVIFGNGIAGDQTVRLSGVAISTVGDGAATQILRLMHQYVDASNHLFSELRVSSAGAVSVVLQKRIAGTNTIIINQTSGITQIVNGTAGQLIDIEARKSGLTWTYHINGVQQATATILASDETALTGATQAGIVGGNGNLIGMTIDYVALLVTPLAPVLRMYNGSAPGQTLAYQVTNQAAMLPVAMDAIFVSHSHNYGTATPQDLQAALHAYVDGLPTAQKRTTLVLRSQNPQKAPALYPVQHAARCAYLKTIAAANDWGHLPCFEAYLATPGYLDLVNIDGIHPLAAGSDIAAAVADAFIAALIA